MSKMGIDRAATGLSGRAEACLKRNCNRAQRTGQHWTDIIRATDRDQKKIGLSRQKVCGIAFFVLTRVTFIGIFAAG